MKVLIVLMLVVILSFLARALILLRRTPSQVKDDAAGVAKALTWRIGLSVALFVFILVAARLGWLRPG